ncbi:MAG: hypothetical protein RIB59_03835 [Rhodospirillales bacterium]
MLNARRLFEKQDSRENGDNFLVSNVFRHAGEPAAALRQRFDLMAEITAIEAKRKAAGNVSNGLSSNWLRRQDSNL